MHPFSTPLESAPAACDATLPQPWPGRGTTLASALLAALALVALTTGFLVAPDGAWTAILIAGLFLLGPTLGSLVFLALLHVTGAGWATAIRRVPEALAALLPLPLAALGVVLLVRPDLYPWWHDAASLEGFHGRWLDPTAFRLRAVVYAGTWLTFSFLLRRRTPGAQRPVTASALFLVVFAFTFWLASVDWLMSLEPHWYSTIFGVYHFASLFTAALAATILAVIWLRWRGVFGGVLNAEHLHDLGKLLFAFTTFWAYTWFSQYMLIWYADLPEETHYFITRSQGPWKPIFWAVFIFHWALPFLLLLTRKAKRSPTVLVAAACAVLLGRFLDLALTVLPAVFATAPGIVGWVAITFCLGLFGAGGWLFAHALGRAPLVPCDDAFLNESLSYRT